MVQVPLTSYHLILTELHTGMLVLAGLCILAVALMKIVPGVKKLGPKLAASLDSTSYVAMIAVTILLVASGIVGMLVYPLKILPMSPILENKIMFSILALNLWLVVSVVRVKSGSGIWNKRGLSAVYTAIAVAALGMVTITGCTSAHLTKTVSPLDPLWELVGVNLDNIIVIPKMASYAMIAVGLALVAITLILALKWRRRKTK
jgi:hypothetical protein